MKKTALIRIILAGIFWGTSVIFVHYLSEYGFTPIQMTGVRATVSFLFMSIFLLIKDNSLFRIKPISLLLILGIGASLFITATLYYSAMRMTSAGVAAVLLYTAPIYVMLYSVFFFGEKFTKLKLVSISFTFIGCCLVSGLIGGLKLDTLGIIFGVLSGIIYAAYNVLTKIAVQHRIAPATTTLYSSLFMLIIALFASSPDKIIENTAKAPTFTIPLLIAIGMFTFVIPYFLYACAMKDLPAGTVSSLGVVEPMSATLFSVLFFKEKLNAFSIVGIILIISAVLIIAKTKEQD